ncbi:MAG: hypothetical protein FWF78_11375 [Defluviitaleaceae bacterium]|nr:hypothetical protein [Defluviitaleaceae bacterium]
MEQFTFKTAMTKGNCAHLAVFNRQLAHDFSTLRDEYTHFWKSDCFECLSPHDIAA